jgi:carbamoyltransferase
MYILGIGGFMHDYNCVLFDLKTKRVAMCEAERLSRKKHHVIRAGEDLLLPVRQCCEELDCKIKDIEIVVFAHTDNFACKDELKKLFPKAKMVEVDHHTCHVAGAFFSSSFKDGLIVSMDGFGDGSSGLLATGSGNKIEEFLRINDENSIGLEYLRATVHLGLGGVGAEGKTQGLAAYGEPTIYEQYMNEIQILSDGDIRLSNKLKSDGSLLTEEGGYLNTQYLSNEFLNSYCQRRFSHEVINDTHKNLASSIQKVLEYTVTEIAKIGKAKTGSENIILSGGVSMNSSMNGVLMQSGLFKKVKPLPMSSDRGISLGAALYYIHQILGEDRFFELKHNYYGQKFSNKDIRKAVKKAGLKYSEIDAPVDLAAQMVSEGKIIGWFQGRSEMGARALGNRSIVADPRRAEMKDIVNKRVKHREWFRPFAPSVVEEKANEFFDFDENVSDLSFMTFTVPANKNAQEKIPAVVHEDNTSRIQTVKRSTNELYANLIDKFGEITGVPVVFNTSFNDNGEPIVETPEDALRTFVNTGLDAVFMGNIFVEK